MISPPAYSAVSSTSEEDTETCVTRDGWAESNSPLGWMCRLFLDHSKIAVWLWNDDLLCLPMMVMWFSSFFGSFSQAVLTFFYLKLGLSASEMGNAGFITTTGGLLLAPFYGYLLDKRSSYGTLVLTTSLCGLGCLVRGMATDTTTVYAAATVMAIGGVNFEAMLLALVVRNAPVTMRSAVVSHYILQMKVLSLAGKGFYPAWNWIVLHGFAVQDQLLRYRIALAACTVPCIIGFMALSYKYCRMSPEQRPINAPVAIPVHSHTVATQPWAFAALSTVLFVQSFGYTMVMLLTPLWTHKYFGWHASQYSGFLLLPMSLFGVLAVASQPHVEGFAVSTCGPRALLLPCTFASLLAACAAAGAFNATDSAALGCSLIILLKGCILFLEPALKSAAPRFLSSEWGGRSFGIMATFAGVGAILGNLAGTRLYESSIAGGTQGTLPLYVLSGVLLISCLLLFAVGWGTKDMASTESGLDGKCADALDGKGMAAKAGEACCVKR